MTEPKQTRVTQIGDLCVSTVGAPGMPWEVVVFSTTDKPFQMWQRRETEEEADRLHDEFVVWIKEA